MAPRPRVPTTSSAASCDCSQSTVAGGPSTDSASAPGAKRCERGAEDVLGVVLRFHDAVGGGRERLADVARRVLLPGAHDAQRQAAQLRLLDRERERGVRLGRAVDARDDPHSDGCPASATTRARCGLRPGTASDATTPAASAAAMRTKESV